MRLPLAVVGGCAKWIGIPFERLFPGTQPSRAVYQTVPMPNVTIILRSDPAPAINTTDVFDYWNGTIEMKDVPILP